ncbi:MAG: low molecular weight phosphotyrosine protein phosphatase [Lachnospiraceae bacterium]|nr:low molecular weight phosphotyrosine protein phosphatase [Lachnospiraceae bacterium]
MIKVLFICHGNICRSPMAEFVFKNMVENRGLEDLFHIASAATSTEEIGSPVHYGTARILDRLHIDYSDKRARQMTKRDYEEYDYLIGMDSRNLRNMHRMIGGDPDDKIHLMLDFTDEPGDVADPWYTGNFEVTYRDVVAGCEGFLEYLKRNGEI